VSFTVADISAAVDVLEANNCPPHADGCYRLHAHPVALMRAMLAKVPWDARVKVDAVNRRARRGRVVR
jgi:hypothetical protein